MSFEGSGVKLEFQSSKWRKYIHKDLIYNNEFNEIEF